MKVLRFIIAMIALLFVWLVVSVGVGWFIGIIFQPKNGAHFLGLWLDWHALPGLAIGLVMGVRAFRAIAGNMKKKQGTDETNAA
jgi:TRAP-type C4-dicarboxylate transport system permease small subunit